MNLAEDPTVSSDEKLARFILQSNWFRADFSVTQNAFMPHPHRLDLSVTRHLQLHEADMWNIGRAVAQKTGRNLYGRADVNVSAVERQKLKVFPAPIPENSNHANITGWPSDKPSQKIIAQEIAASAGKAVIAPLNS